MKAFMDENFLLETETAQRLFHQYAADMPILDYHCHIRPQEIAEDQKFENITQLWLKEDHYKWRLMRANGVEEAYITGGASDREKFQKWAETLEKAIGNPLYHWSHLELQRYFQYYGPLNGKTAQKVWEISSQKIKENNMTAKNLLLQSNVRCLCTTDDPADTLQWHDRISEEEDFPVQVLPAWRPDRAMNIEKQEYPEYLEKLEDISRRDIHSFGDLTEMLQSRMDYFAQRGCCVADHGLEYVMYVPASREELENIFAKGRSGKALSQREILQYKTALLLWSAREYHKRGWAMQLHYGVKRDNNTRLLHVLGPDAGADCIRGGAPAGGLTDFLNALAAAEELPKTILYSLDPNDNALLGSIIGCFQEGNIPGKIQHGSAWWFNDHKQGIKDHLTNLAAQGLLGNFIGMLTDSRSFLSYTRHEYFRRILCDLIGSWVERGEYPADEQVLGRMVQDISYNNAVRYFSLGM